MFFSANHFFFFFLEIVEEGLVGLGVEKIETPN